MSDTNDLELRILNGLHRGASLPLDDQPQLIGSADDADIVLVDPGIEPRHAVLRLDGGSWSLLSLDGLVRGATADAPADQPQLAPGDCARVGRIWLTVTASDVPWQDPPVDPPALEAVAQEEVAETEQELEPETDEVMLQEEPAPEAPPAPIARPRRRRSRIIMLPVALGAGLVAAAAYSYTSRPGESLRPPAASLATLAEKPGPLTPKALRQAFRDRLAEVDLLRRFDLTLEDHAWTMRAALDDEDAVRFRRILAAFVATHKITFPVDVKLGGADSMLPFKVRQVISGANASIVTDDGQRMYPGDDYRGVRLVAIEPNRISFNGRQPIEVKW